MTRSEGFMAFEALKVPRHGRACRNSLPSSAFGPHIGLAPAGPVKSAVQSAGFATRGDEIMALRWTGILRACREILSAILIASLLVWVATAPLVWILRDGLGPDQVDSGWVRSVFRFLVGWGVP